MLLRWTGVPDARVIGDADRLPENTELATEMRGRAELCLRKLNQIAAGDAAEPFGWHAACASWLDEVCDRILITLPGNETIGRATAEIGSYLGELIVRNFKSWWVYDLDAQAAGVDTAYQHRFFPHAKVSKRLARRHRQGKLPFLLAHASAHSLGTFYHMAVTGRIEPGTKITRRDAPLRG